MGTHPPGSADDPKPVDSDLITDSSSLALISHVLHDFGEDFKIASVFVCAADSIGGAQNDIDNYCAELWKARRSGKVGSGLACMQDEEFESHIRASGKQAADRYAQLAARKLSELLAAIVDTSRAECLLATLGVARTPNGFSPIPRDEEIAASIVRTAKLMDRDYKTSMAIRSIVTRNRGEKSEGNLADEDDPQFAQIWSELEGEL